MSQICIDCGRFLHAGITMYFYFEREDGSRKKVQVRYCSICHTKRREKVSEMMANGEEEEAIMDDRRPLKEILRKDEGSWPGDAGWFLVGEATHNED